MFTLSNSPRGNLGAPSLRVRSQTRLGVLIGGVGWTDASFVGSGQIDDVPQPSRAIVDAEVERTLEEVRTPELRPGLLDMGAMHHAAIEGYETSQRHP